MTPTASAEAEIRTTVAAAARPGIAPGMNRLPPYGELLGLRIVADDARFRLVMPFGANVLGRPGFLHGGAIAGLLEFAAFGALRAELGDETAVIKPVSVSLDFLRGGTDRDTHAGASVKRLGKRIAHVEASAWQDDEDKPIATARMNLMLRRR